MLVIFAANHKAKNYNHEFMPFQFKIGGVEPENHK